MKSTDSRASENPLRGVPSVDALLQSLGEEISRRGHQQVTAVVRSVLAEVRAEISVGASPDLGGKHLREKVIEILFGMDQPGLKRVFNLTGTVLHTNLGRASLPAVAVDAVVSAALHPSNLEFDLESGRRGDREKHLEALLCELTGAEAATAVNNNAAAVLLVLNTLAFNQQVPVSRGELVEIGGSFRIPEVMQRANCSLVEVGSTNRTHPKDYEAAINSETALLMKVHTSNYRVEGFTRSVGEEELASLAHRHDLPMVVDLGSGCLMPFAPLGLPDEQTASQVISWGADIITFSGDKLLGGPQCGLIAGRKDLIEQIKRNPLKRALRLDKMTLAAITEVLRLYRDPDAVLKNLPTLRHLTRPVEDIERQALLLLQPFSEALGSEFVVEVAPCLSQIGSGALPVETIASAALKITPSTGADDALRALASRFRSLSIPVVGRLHNGTLWFDLRCLEEEQELLTQLRELTP